MSRIRTIKPEFFRHETLQDLESETPKLKPMLVYAGLWTLSDKKGSFEWRPRQIKLDILPFISFNITETLDLLSNNGFIFKYTVEGKDYGFIPAFAEHQRITGKELQSPSKYPEPTQEDIEKHSGSIREVPENTPDVQEGKGKGKDISSSNLKDFPLFWEAWPNKVDKKAAEERWAKMNGTRPAITILLEAIRKQTEWRKNAGPDDFRPPWKNPATWLNGRCWEDEVDPPKPKSVFS
jgi:hypothetical protein